MPTELVQLINQSSVIYSRLEDRQVVILLAGLFPVFVAPNDFRLLYDEAETTPSFWDRLQTSKPSKQMDIGLMPKPESLADNLDADIAHGITRCLILSRPEVLVHPCAVQ